jgi:hypothetical protein
LTPLPGSEDHKVLWQKGIWMDPDLNKYDLEQVVTGHAQMSKEQWESIYRRAWKLYYTPDHMETVIRRATAYDVGVSHLTGLLTIFSMAVEIENVHPLQGGLFRRKYRTDRRHGMPIESVWTFYPRYAWEIVTKCTRIAWRTYALDRLRRKIRKDPLRYEYFDAALAPVADDETDRLERFTHNEAARREVERTRRIAELTGGARPLAVRAPEIVPPADYRVTTTGVPTLTRP